MAGEADIERVAYDSDENMLKLVRLVVVVAAAAVVVVVPAEGIVANIGPAVGVSAVVCRYMADLRNYSGHSLDSGRRHCAHALHAPNAQTCSA